jgi:CheY-like chemotaxis protein
MARILLVDNDQAWLNLIKGSMPAHEVDTASSYDEAERAICSGVAYDVAIVDLNLIDSAERHTNDLLGGKILELLRARYPATRRIALTAYSPSSAKRVIDRYAVDDLLLKGNMALSVVPEVVDAALALTSGLLPPGARARRSELYQDFAWWRQGRVLWFERQLKHLRNEVGSSVIQPDTDDATVAALQARLAELEARQKYFISECARVASTLDRIGSADDVTLEQREIRELKQEFDTDDVSERSPGP